MASRTISVPITNDSAEELTESLTIALSSPVNASLAVPNTPVTVSIIDDETPPPLGDELYTYDKLGNILSKTGVGTYSYSAAHPHAVTSAGPFGFGYDANGNMTTAGGQITTWDAENRPTRIGRVSGTETYAYDADSERIGRTAGFTTTVFLGGMWQEDVASGAVGLTRVLYGFNGASVAQRTHVTSPSSDSVVYLHGDHLGSVSVVSGWNGSATTLVSSQRFDPWGKVIAGGNVTQTRSNYTGQELDTTGLLYYHARFYDPNLGRFLSADTVVPGSASGGMDGVQLRPLTVDFHEPGFAAQLGGENGQAFWFQMSDEQRGKVGSPWGPASPQALNRYSYVWNNPLRYIDPTGHLGITVHDNGSFTLHLTHNEAWALWNAAGGGIATGSVLIPYVFPALKLSAFITIILTKVLPPLLLIGLVLGAADYLLGEQGVDVTLNDPGGVRVGAPTVNRQHGEYYDPGAAKVRNALRSQPTSAPPTDVPESQQYCNYGYSNDQGPVMGPC